MKRSLPKGFVSPHKLAGLPSSESVLLAYSGGPDSSALLHMLVRYCAEVNSTLYVAHLDHMIRKDEHTRDLEFCKNTAEKYGIRIFFKSVNIPDLAKERGESEELTARYERYEFFRSIMQEHSISILVTAHNADDNLETVILNLIRGSGTKGLCGIPACRPLENGVAVRPILEMTKDDVLSYCSENGVEWVFDSTNATPDYTRNRIRLQILPELRKINPEAAKTALRTCRNLKEDEEFLHALADQSKVISQKGIDVERFNRLEAPLKHRIIASYTDGLERVHSSALCELCKKNVNGSSVSLPGSVRAKIQNGYLILECDTRESHVSEKKSFEIVLHNGENQISPELLLYVSDNDTIIHKSETQISIASDKINGQLVARSRRSGDKILIRGMHRSVKKLMCDLKIPIEIRNSIPVICDDDGIVFIPYIGVRDGMLSKKSNQMTYLSLKQG